MLFLNIQSIIIKHCRGTPKRCRAISPVPSLPIGLTTFWSWCLSKTHLKSIVTAVICPPNYVFEGISVIILYVVHPVMCLNNVTPWTKSTVVIRSYVHCYYCHNCHCYCHSNQNHCLHKYVNSFSPCKCMVCDLLFSVNPSHSVMCSLTITFGQSGLLMIPDFPRSYFNCLFNLIECINVYTWRV